MLQLQRTEQRSMWPKHNEQQRGMMRVKEESEKAGLKLNIQRTKIMASGPITSWQIAKIWGNN